VRYVQKKCTGQPWPCAGHPRLASLAGKAWPGQARPKRSKGELQSIVATRFFSGQPCGRWERAGSGADEAVRGTGHLTLPLRGPLPLPPEGRRGLLHGPVFTANGGLLAYCELNDDMHVRSNPAEPSRLSFGPRLAEEHDQPSNTDFHRIVAVRVSQSDRAGKGGWACEPDTDLELPKGRSVRLAYVEPVQLKLPL
jgi:hypothetical protein